MKNIEGKIRELVAAGEPITHDTVGVEDFTIPATLLRELLIGVSVHGKNTLTAAGITICGSSSKRIPIIGSPAQPGMPSYGEMLDLGYLTSADAEALPPLVLRWVELPPHFRVAHSRFAALTLDGCTIERLDARSLQVEGDCRLKKLSAPQAGGPCQVFMMGARIDGSLDLRASKLKAPAPDERERQRERPRWRRFAISAAGCEITGGILMTNGFEAEGGVGLYQADIRNSVRLRDARITAPDYSEDNRERIAIDCGEAKIGGSFFWGGRNNPLPWDKCRGPMPIGTAAQQVEKNIAELLDGQDDDWQVMGSIVFQHAAVDGDIHFKNCRWRVPRPNDPPDTVGGGIDVRFATLGGQLRLSGNCIVARRAHAPSGLEPYSSLGPAVDCWKSSLARGVRIEQESLLCGPLLLNGCVVGREVHLGGRITCLGHRNVRQLYCQSLDLSDSRIEGVIDVLIDYCDGRVSFQRAHVEGSVEIKRLALQFRGTRYCSYLEDRTAILDMQDFRISGSLNFHTDSVTVADVGQDNRLDPAACCGEPVDPDLPRVPKDRHIIDLRGLCCDSFDDSDGKAWAPMELDKREANQPARQRSPIRRYIAGGRIFRGEWPWRLRMDGIEFARIDRSEMKSSLLDRDIEEYRLRTIRSYFDNRPNQPKTLVRKFLKSCGRHFGHRPHPLESERRQVPPQPYEIFASAYLRRGEIDSALFLITQRNWGSWWARQRSFDRTWLRSLLGLGGGLSLLVLGLFVLPRLEQVGVIQPAAWLQALEAWLLVIGALLLISPLILLLFIVLYGSAFGFGLKPRRALATFVISIGLCATLMSTQPLTVRASSAATEDKAAADRRPSEAEAPVDSEVNRILYAIDIFIPILDLGHERDYDIGPRQAVLALLKGLFELLGWLITSLTVLTITGVLRRDIERSK